MLSEYKQRFLGKNLQFILLDNDGMVVESDQNLFELRLGKSIVETHPFFESFPSFLGGDETTFTFFCIHLSIGSDSFITDITLTIEEDRIILVIHDLTQHYEAYQNVAQARNESIIETELTVIKNKELEERERFKNQFIQNFSHEIRNPLTSIMAIANIIADTDLTAEQRKMLDFLKESNSALALMLEDILSIGAIDSGKVELQEKSFKLVKLFKLLEFTYKTKTRQKGIEFKASLDGKIPEFVLGDRLRLYQVLTNLLDNALKYSPTSPRIQVHLTAEADQIILHIQDEGIGIAATHQDKIFDKFFRVPQGDQHDVKGYGLGLSYVKAMMDAHDATIAVKSEIGKGGSFILKFPRKQVVR